jgi:2-C-methyl-D-erythritol 4-phosphate cytidylyltransferase
MEKNKPQKVIGIILAGGSGSRMGADTTKQKMQILGKSVLYRSVYAFEKCAAVDEIIIVARDGELDFAKAETAEFSKVKRIVRGGSCRAESAKCGFLEVDDENSLVLIHDAARCMVLSSDIETVAKDTLEHGCATASYLVVDTIKQVDEGNFVEKTVPRDNLRAVQTPQGCHYSLYKRAIEACECLAAVTDDNMLLEAIGLHPYCSETSRHNIKITTMSDIALAEFLLAGRLNEI